MTISPKDSTKEMNTLFYKFRDLLPPASHEEFTQWYSNIFDALANAETELAMQEYKETQRKTSQTAAKIVKIARHPIDHSDLAQLNLGQLIELLEATPDRSLPIKFEGLSGNSTPYLHSWHGFYQELAVEFETTDEHTSVNEFIIDLKKAINTHFSGWKGDEFLTTEQTPLWVATFGESKGFYPELKNCDTQAITGIKILPDMIEIQSAITHIKNNEFE